MRSPKEKVDGLKHETIRFSNFSFSFCKWFDAHLLSNSVDEIPNKKDNKMRENFIKREIKKTKRKE